MTDSFFFSDYIVSIVTCLFCLLRLFDPDFRLSGRAGRVRKGSKLPCVLHQVLNPKPLNPQSPKPRHPKPKTLSRRRLRYHLGYRLGDGGLNATLTAKHLRGFLGLESGYIWV